MRFLESFTWVHVFIVSLLAALLVGAAVYFFLPGSYTAASVLLMEDRPDPLAVASGDGFAEGPSLERINAILASRTLRERVSTRLSLPERMGLSEVDALGALTEMVSIRTIGNDGVRITVTVGGFVEPRVALLGHSLSLQDARELSASIANVYHEELGDYLREVELERVREGREMLAYRRDNLQAELDQSRDSLQTLRSRYELIDPDSRAARLGERIRTLEQDHANAAAEADAASSALRAAEAELNTVDSTRIASAVETRNPLISSLEQELVGLNTELAAELAAGKTREHRDVAQLQSAIDSITDQLAEVQERVLRDVGEQPNPLYDDTIRRVVELRVQLAGARARRAEMNSLLRDARARMSEMPAVAREYVEIGSREETTSDRLSSIERAVWAAELEEARAELSAPFRLLDAATPPEEQHGPPAILAALITFAALMVLQGLLIIDRRWFGG